MQLCAWVIALQEKGSYAARREHGGLRERESSRWPKVGERCPRSRLPPWSAPSSCPYAAHTAHSLLDSTRARACSRSFSRLAHLRNYSTRPHIPAPSLATTRGRLSVRASHHHAPHAAPRPRPPRAGQARPLRPRPRRPLAPRAAPPLVLLAVPLVDPARPARRAKGVRAVWAHARARPLGRETRRRRGGACKGRGRRGRRRGGA